MKNWKSGCTRWTTVWASVIALSVLPAIVNGQVKGPDDCSDRVTGGGWIVGTPSGGFANFGVAGGIHAGGFWGHLNYLDHDLGMHVKSQTVTAYIVDPTDPLCRIITFDVTIDGEPGEAIVRVCDFSEPGWDDTFEIELSNGYFAGGDLADDQPGGGNIQLHPDTCP